MALFDDLAILAVLIVMPADDFLVVSTGEKKAIVEPVQVLNRTVMTSYEA